jgi:hypothetical protein
MRLHEPRMRCRSGLIDEYDLFALLTYLHAISIRPGLDLILAVCNFFSITPVLLQVMWITSRTRSRSPTGR